MTKKRIQKIYDVKLDKEEKELSDAIDKEIEKGQLKSVRNLEEKLVQARKSADQYLKKDARVTLRLSTHDLSKLKQKAAYKGLPYQTFIAGILHEYVEGHFIEVT